jgi:hypothetical protein
MRPLSLVRQMEEDARMREQSSERSGGASDYKSGDASDETVE